MSLRRSFQPTKVSQKINKSLRTDTSSVSSKDYNHESRNIPHTKRVIHIKGLNDIPICFVRGAEQVSENLSNSLRKYKRAATNNVSTKRTPVEKTIECRHSDDNKQGDNQETKASLHLSQLPVSQSAACGICMQCYQRYDAKNIELKDLMKFCEFLHKDSKSNVNIWVLKASQKALQHFQLENHGHLISININNIFKEVECMLGIPFNSNKEDGYEKLHKKLSCENVPVFKLQQEISRAF